jgi:hypothetical protein
MTYDSTHLVSMSSLPSPMSVKTVDGTPLAVVSHGTLHTPRFHVPQLHLQLFSTGQIADHGCRVVLDSDASIHDRRTWTLVGSGRQLCDPPRLWKLDWLHLPPVSTSHCSTLSLSWCVRRILYIVFLPYKCHLLYTLPLGPLE